MPRMKWDFVEIQEILKISNPNVTAFLKYEFCLIFLCKVSKNKYKIIYGLCSFNF